MGLYEWRFRISLAAAQQFSASPPVRQAPSVRTAFLPVRVPPPGRNRQIGGRFFTFVRACWFF